MTLHILVCFVLVIVIMLQSGNAADLAGAFGGAGSQTAFGPRGAATFLSRSNTWCAASGRAAAISADATVSSAASPNASKEIAPLAMPVA